MLTKLLKSVFSISLVLITIFFITNFSFAQTVNRKNSKRVRRESWGEKKFRRRFENHKLKNF